MSGDRVERRLAAILAADVAGYSRLMSADEEGTLAALKSVRQSLIDPKVAEHRGRVVKTTDDGVLVEFASAVDAARCAVDIQQAMAERNAGVPEPRRIEFRIGINVGDIIADGGDIYGDGVNIAARVEAQATAGGVCLSDNAYQQIKGKLALEVSDMGEQALKNIPQPVRLYSVRLDAAPALSALAWPDKPSIAVLPFQNMSGDPEQEYFADGMVEEIITGLSRLKWLFVIARNSSFTYKGRAVDVRQVGRELRPCARRQRAQGRGARAHYGAACGSRDRQSSVGRQVRRRNRRRIRFAGSDHARCGARHRAVGANGGNRTRAPKAARKSRCIRSLPAGAAPCLGQQSNRGAEGAGASRSGASHRSWIRHSPWLRRMVSSRLVRTRHSRYFRQSIGN